MTVGPGEEAVLAIPENANAGWVATVDGHPLARTRVDGWQQAWIVPAGAGGVVVLACTPDHSDRLGLLIGRLAAWHGFTEGLLWSSGFAANSAVLGGLPERGDLVFADRPEPKRRKR